MPQTPYSVVVRNAATMNPRTSVSDWSATLNAALTTVPRAASRRSEPPARVVSGGVMPLAYWHATMRISVASDERTGVADTVVTQLRRRGHEVLLHGALSDAERDDWAWASEAAARDVAEGRAEQAVVCCWTGTGASIAANKVGGIRAALCLDAQTADGARRWNDANALAISLRATSEAELEEILDAWFGGQPSADSDDTANVAHLAEIEGDG